MAEFHFLRPLWLLALVPALLLVLRIWRRQQRGEHWTRLVDPALLPWLVEGSAGRDLRLAAGLLLAGWTLACLALAGPAWERLPQVVHRQVDALAIVLDLSLSMYAEDEKPSRIARARHKLQDVLERRREGQTALVVYAGDAFTVTPFTDDSRTIANHVQALDPGIMPVPGSRPLAALERVAELVANAGLPTARVLLISDGIDADRAPEMRAWSRRHDMPIDILGVGSAEGAPVPLPRGGFLKRRDGSIVIAGFDAGVAADLAGETGGRFAAIGVDDRDLDRLLDPGPLALPAATRASEREFDAWREEGPWLLLILLPLAALGYRRGWLGLVLVCAVSLPEPARAIDWGGLLLNRDQQGHEAFEQEAWEDAAERFADPGWRASALYRAGRYDEAAAQWAAIDSPGAHYNRGNALARAGQLEEAIEAYERALGANPEFEDARHNRELLEQLMKQQESQQQQSQSGQNQSPPDSGSTQDPGQGDSGGQDSSGRGDAAQQDGQRDDQAEREPGDPTSASEPDSTSQSDDANGESGQDSIAQDPPANGDTPARTGTGEPQDGERQEATTAGAEADPEAQQAMEQWLRRIPDDPSALLRRKFQYQYEERRRRGDLPGENGQPW